MRAGTSYKPGKLGAYESRALLFASAMLALAALGCAPTLTGKAMPGSPASKAEKAQKAEQAAGSAAVRPGVAEVSAESFPFQFIFVIHGDAGYTYHDRNGISHAADADAVDQAVFVARSSPAAEVYIFHQKPTRFMGFFRRSDATMQYYRGGTLVEKRGYRRDPDDVELEAEAELYRALSSAPEAGTVRAFAWFGHEIPVTSEVPYSRSRPDSGFTVASFAKGLERFGGPIGPGGKPFALVLLSSCHGGTPEATSAILPYSAYLVASPGELHLSFLDARALSRMAEERADGFWLAQAETWGRNIATESFARLQNETTTAITVSLYDSPKASAYLEARREAWMRAPEPAMENRDCASVPGFGPGGAEAGVTVFQQTPRFGPDKLRSNVSGWECRVPRGSPSVPSVPPVPVKPAPVAASDPS